MPSKITVERLGANSLRLSRINEAGQTEEMVKGGFNDSSDIRKAAKRLGATKDDILALIDGFRAGTTTEFVLPVPSVSGGIVSVRGLYEPDAAAVQFDADTTYDALRKALAYDGHPAPEPLIRWGGLATLAAVDVDYKAMYRPTAARAEQVFRTIHPTPPVSWITHGGGLRMIYHPIGKWTAEELAAIAGVWLAHNEPLGRVEVNNHTRHPAYRRGEQRASELFYQPADLDIGHLQTLISQRVFELEEIDAWLADHAMTRGKTHAHTFCRINPHEHPRNEVYAGDEGLFCFLCAARGDLYRGQRKPGFVPYGALLGDIIPTSLKTCVARMAHWTHAAAVFNAVLPGLPFAKAVYAALLKLTHGDDPRIETALRERNFVRLGREWATVQGEPLAADGLTTNLAGLPACMDIHDGEVEVNKERLEMFKQPIDLSTYGYPSLSPVYGAKLHGHFLPPISDERLPFVVQQPELAEATRVSRRPRYINRESRGSLYGAWKRVNSVYPGINRRAIYLLIAAKAWFESGGGVPSMIFFEGASGSGKSQSVHVAAAIVGDGATEAGYRPDRDHIYRTVAEASRRGSFCVFNEIVKHTQESGKSIVEGLDFLLNLTPHQTYHKLYHGPTVLGDIPVIVLTDTTLPQEIYQDKQIARRVIHVHMGSTMKRWERSLAEAGVHNSRRLRLADEPLSSACDIIMSHVIDKWFRTSPPASLAEIASDLGFNLISESDSYAAYRQSLRDLFYQVSAHPQPNAADRKYAGEGYKVLDERALENTTLGSLWSGIHDPGNWSSWNRCNAEDWQEILGWEEPLECIVRPLRAEHKSKVKIGFRGVRTGRWVSAVGVDEQPRASVHGHRDTELPRFEKGWLETLSQ